MIRRPALRTLPLLLLLMITASLALAADEMPDTSGMTPLQRLVWQAKQMNKEAGLEETKPTVFEIPAGVRRLTETGGDEGDCAWSPDGASIYYDYREGQLQEIRRFDLADGKIETVSLPMESARNPQISPDGRFMAFMRNTPPLGRKVWVMRLEDGEQAKLVPGQGREEEADPIWSRSGAKLYLSVHNKGIPFFTPYEITREGERMKSLAGAHDLPGSSYKHPSLSPDGKQLAWALRRGRSGTINVMNTRIAGLSEEYEFPGYFIGLADWLPGGDRMVVSYLVLDEPRAGYSLGFADLATRTLTPWLNLSSSDGNVSVSPDGKQLAFTAKVDGHSELFIADLP
jgi:Tol biopolymer transport system component